MTNIVDFHTHSYFSDGVLSPYDIINRARKLNIDAIALTDHDTTGGIAELLLLQDEFDVEVISGVELSAQHNLAPVHILGYGLQHDSPLLQESLNNIQNARKRRNLMIFERLRKLGFNLTINDITQTIEKKSGQKLKSQIGRPHIAELLVKKRIVQNESAAFANFIGLDKPAYVARKRLSAEEAISIIKNAEGLAVLAHPAIADPTCINSRGLIQDLHSIGLDGIEVYHPSHNSKHIRFFNNLCRELNILATGGSDFHGRTKDRIELGQYAKNKFIDYNLLHGIKSKLSKLSKLN